MTRSELIEAMAKAAKRKSPAYWSEVRDAEKHWDKAMEAALSAIEQAGMVVVPVQPLPEMTAAWYRYKNGHRFAGEEPARDTSDYGAYAAMIEAGRLK